MGTDEDYETSYRYQSVTRFSMQILIRRGCKNFCVFGK